VLLLLFVVAVIVAVAIVTSTQRTVVQVRTIITNDAHSAIHTLQGWINQYTK
jgi:hypothetical protein